MFLIFWVIFILTYILFRLNLSDRYDKSYSLIENSNSKNDNLTILQFLSDLVNDKYKIDKPNEVLLRKKAPKKYFLNKFLQYRSNYQYTEIEERIQNLLIKLCSIYNIDARKKTKPEIEHIIENLNLNKDTINIFKLLLQLKNNIFWAKQQFKKNEIEIVLIKIENFIKNQNT